MTRTELCPSCGDFVSRLDSYTGWCGKCSGSDPYIQLESYLSRNANHLEYYIANKGQTFEQALLSLRLETRPTCSSCGGVIKHGSRNSIFCSKNPICRKASNRYNYLHKQKSLPKYQALAIVLRELENTAA